MTTCNKCGLEIKDHILKHYQETTGNWKPLRIKLNHKDSLFALEYLSSRMPFDKFKIVKVGKGIKQTTPDNGPHVKIKKAKKSKENHIHEIIHEKKKLNEGFRINDEVPKKYYEKGHQVQHCESGRWTTLVSNLSHREAEKVLLMYQSMDRFNSETYRSVVQ
jgi:hypothetical protein